jgi:hypothetical protein
MDDDQIRRIQQYFRLLQQQMNDDDDDDIEFEIYEHEEYEDDEDEDLISEEEQPEMDTNIPKETDAVKQQKTFLDDQPQFTHRVMLDSGGCTPNKPDQNVMEMIQKRQIGSYPSFSSKNKAHITQRQLPKTPKTLSSFHEQMFCGRFSSDGDYYMSACKGK